MKIFKIFITVVALSMSLTHATENQYKMMTFNIRNGQAKDGENHWLKRKELVAETIKSYNGDVVGLQEAFRFQLDFLNKHLADYVETGIGRDGGEKGEYSAVLYKKDRFDLVESGTFWLSDTPEKVSASWGNWHKRICTWVKLKDKKTGQMLCVFNTHMDHKSQNSREKSIELIMKRASKYQDKYPVVIMGDFNAAENNKVVLYAKGKAELKAPFKLIDSYREIHKNEKFVGTFSRWNGYKEGGKIDYIFVCNKLKVLEAKIDRSHKNGRYPSDHYPVTTTVEMK